MKHHIFFPKNYHFFNKKTQDLINIHFKKDPDFIFHNNVTSEVVKTFIDEHKNLNESAIFYYHPSADNFEITILNYIDSITDKLTLKIVFFTFDFWLRGNTYSTLLKKVFKAKNHYVFTFADNMNILNSFHNADYTPYEKNIIFSNIWSAYNTSFINFIQDPINKLAIVGRLSTCYLDRIRLSKSKNPKICIVKNVPQETRSSHNQFNKRISKYIACLSSPPYWKNPRDVLENTHLIPLKTFEILASGSLLVCPITEQKYLEKIGLIHMKNCYLIDTKKYQKCVDFITNADNRDTINKIRKNGQDFAKTNLNSFEKYKQIKNILESL